MVSNDLYTKFLMMVSIPISFNNLLDRLTPTKFEDVHKLPINFDRRETNKMICLETKKSLYVIILKLDVSVYGAMYC
jgi:hypothetical protein